MKRHLLARRFWPSVVALVMAIGFSVWYFSSGNPAAGSWAMATAGWIVCCAAYQWCYYGLLDKQAKDKS